MLYALKRYFLYHLKVLEILFKTRKKQKEIAKAYHTEIIFPAISITRPMLVWTGIGIAGIGLIILVTTYSDNIVQKVQNIRVVLQRKNKAITVKRRSMDVATRRKKTVTESTGIALQTVKKDTMPYAIAKKDIPSSVLQKRALQFSNIMNYLILANKATRIMYVMNKRNDVWALFREYTMAIGEQVGRKVRAGDKKTPEGLYFIIGRKERSELTNMYGPLAFVLNYPNDEDRKKGRTGNGIWIHGTNPDSTPVQTRGCLELNNNSIREMGRYLKTGISIPVLIINNENIENPVAVPNYEKIQEKRKRIIIEYKMQQDFFISLLENWTIAWESRDIEQYARYYNADTFTGQGMDWSAWKERKARTFEMYDTIKITLDNIFLADFSESTAVLKFIQGYKSDRLHVVNGKKLNLVKSEGNWKIYMENSLPKEELLL